MQKIYDMIAEGQRNHPDEDDDEEDEDDMEGMICFSLSPAMFILQ